MKLTSDPLSSSMSSFIYFLNLAPRNLADACIASVLTPDSSLVNTSRMCPIEVLIIASLSESLS